MCLVVLHLALCCVTGLLQMTRRSPKGKNIVPSDQSTPIAKQTRLSSQSSKDSNCERFRTPLNSHIYSSIFDLASPIVERVVEFNTLKTTFVPRIFESRDWATFTFLNLNTIKLMCVPCGIAFGSLLCDYSLVDDSSFS